LQAQFVNAFVICVLLAKPLAPILAPKPDVEAVFVGESINADFTPPEL